MKGKHTPVLKDLVLVGGGHAHVTVSEKVCHAACARSSRNIDMPGPAGALFRHVAGVYCRALYL